MFWQIFLFELKYRLKRPAAYVYFFCFFFMAFMSFAHGALPVVEKEFYNAPAMLALYSSMTSIFMMLASSAIMGVPLYRDIEYNTKDYYLSYPITKPGYFWGRFLGSFFFVALIGSAVFWGAYAGTLGGPAFRWSSKANYLPFHFYDYLHPYLNIVLPNIFFTSALFFGLVAIFRNVKVIYSSGIFLFLGYIISNFFFHHSATSMTVIYLSDPFAFIPLRMTTGPLSPEALNGSVIHIQGLLLANRILWTAIGALILLGTYLRFSFERFFSGSAGQKKEPVQNDRLPGKMQNGLQSALQIRFTGDYIRKILYNLTRIEIINIVRDNYFWIILTGGLGFLGFLFWVSFTPYGVPDFPRAAFFMDVYRDNFGFFLFFIITFYTGETVHRERITRYAFINDSLPPPNWVLGSAKVLSLLALALFLAIVPVLLGVIVQILKGYHSFNFPVYFTSLFVVNIPTLIEMVLFSYVIQMIVSNKFAGYGIGIGIYVLMAMVNNLGYFTYLLLLYGNTPSVLIFDMDRAGHMLKPLLWFHGYWLLAGCCLLVIAALFFNRGTNNSFKERLRLVKERWRGGLRVASLFLLAGFLVAGGYIYYNVSVLNVYLTRNEHRLRGAMAEKQLKQYERLPFPTVTRLRLRADLFPGEQKELGQAWITIRNNTTIPIDTLLMDGDNLTDYSLTYQGQHLSYSCPLFFPRGKFNFLRPAVDPSEYRLYILPAALLPGDTAQLEIRSLVEHRGFQNNFYAGNLLHNGLVYTGGLPGLGYDDDEEIGNNDIRKEYGLAPKGEPPLIAHDDPRESRRLDASPTSGLTQLDITVSTSGDQWAIGPGKLDKEWQEGDRHYFHYAQQGPGMYPPFAILSARYARKKILVPIEGSDPVRLSLYYHPAHTANLDRFLAVNKDGLQYMSAHYGPYTAGDFSLVESSVYGPRTGHFAGITTFSETYGWNADFSDTSRFDYLYLEGAEMLAGQWWGQQVAPNHTAGAVVIATGIPKYLGIVLMERKYGLQKLWDFRRQEMQGYLWGRRRSDQEHTLLYAVDWNDYNQKASIVLYGLRDLIGEDSVNAGLREFHDRFAFRTGTQSYAGSEDLYKALQNHTPDSCLYYLTDTWEKICLYDNKVLDAKAVPAGSEGRPGDYKVTLKVFVQKVYIDSTKKERPATGVNDLISIGVYATDQKELYLQKHRFTAGEHTIELIVHGKPASAGIDPKGVLIDRNLEDNRKTL